MGPMWAVHMKERDGVSRPFLGPASPSRAPAHNICINSQNESNIFNNLWYLFRGRQWGTPTARCAALSRRFAKTARRAAGVVRRAKRRRDGPTRLWSPLIAPPKCFGCFERCVKLSPASLPSLTNWLPYKVRFCSVSLCLVLRDALNFLHCEIHTSAQSTCETWRFSLALNFHLITRNTDKVHQ